MSYQIKKMLRTIVVFAPIVAALAWVVFNIQKPVAESCYKVLVNSLLDIEKHLKKSGPFFLGKFTHIDINLMCCFHRLIDIRLDSLLEMDELPNLKAYWSKLKERESYKQGILNFYGEKEIGDVEELFGSDVSMHLKPLTKMIQNSTDSL